MTDEKKIIKGLDKELIQLIDAEMNDPVLGKLLNRNAAYVLGKEIKLLFINKACEWLDENMNDVGIRFMRGDEIKDIVDLFRKAMEGGEE